MLHRFTTESNINWTPIITSLNNATSNNNSTFNSNSRSSSNSNSTSNSNARSNSNSASNSFSRSDNNETTNSNANRIPLLLVMRDRIMIRLLVVIQDRIVIWLLIVFSIVLRNQISKSTSYNNLRSAKWLTSKSNSRSKFDF